MGIFRRNSRRRRDTTAREVVTEVGAEAAEALVLPGLLRVAGAGIRGAVTGIAHLFS